MRCYGLSTILLPLFLGLVITGCAPKKSIPLPPDPMTEAYLLDHVTRTESRDAVLFRLPPLTQHPVFGDGNSTLHATLSIAYTPMGEVKGTLFCTLYASRWGGFKTAVDTLGERHDVISYTSGIREGRFFENFYFTFTRGWLHLAAKNDLALLFISPSDELPLTLPSVYLRALNTLVDTKITP